MSKKAHILDTPMTGLTVQTITGVGGGRFTRDTIVGQRKGIIREGVENFNCQVLAKSGGEPGWELGRDVPGHRNRNRRFATCDAPSQLDQEKQRAQSFLRESRHEETRES